MNCTNCAPVPQEGPDLRFENHGTIFLLQPLTEAGSSFIQAHAPEDAQYWGAALVIEHRYAGDWAKGALDDGLTLAR